MIIVAMMGLISYCLDGYTRSVKQLFSHAADMSATPTIALATSDRATTTAHERAAPTLYDYFELDELRLLLGLVPPRLSPSWSTKGRWLEHRIGHFRDLKMCGDLKMWRKRYNLAPSKGQRKRARQPSKWQESAATTRLISQLSDRNMMERMATTLREFIVTPPPKHPNSTPQPPPDVMVLVSLFLAAVVIIGGVMEIVTLQCTAGATAAPTTTTYVWSRTLVTAATLMHSTDATVTTHFVHIETPARPSMQLPTVVYVCLALSLIAVVFRMLWVRSMHSPRTMLLRLTGCEFDTTKWTHSQRESYFAKAKEYADKAHAAAATHSWHEDEPELYEDMLRSFVKYHEINHIPLEHATWMVNMFVFVPDLCGYSDITGDYELCANRTFVQFAGCLWVCGDIWMIPDNMPQAMRMAVLHKYGQVPIPTAHLHSDGRILRRYSIGPETAYETSGGDCAQQAAIQAQPSVPPPMVMPTLSNGAARSRDKTPVRKRVRVSVTASQMIGSAFFGGTTAAEGAATADVWNLVKLPKGVVAIPNLLLTREVPVPVATYTYHYDVFATVLAMLLVVMMVVAMVLILKWLMRYCRTLTARPRLRWLLSPYFVLCLLTCIAPVQSSSTADTLPLASVVTSMPTVTNCYVSFWIAMAVFIATLDAVIFVHYYVSKRHAIAQWPPAPPVQWPTFVTVATVSNLVATVQHLYLSRPVQYTAMRSRWLIPRLLW
jgi:hypothetical protein